MDVETEDLPRFLFHPGVDLVEWRLDALVRRHSQEAALEALQLLSLAPRHSLVATNRPVREGGLFAGTEDRRIEVLQRAAEAGAEWVDLESDVSLDTVKLIADAGARVLLSHHDFSATPERPALRKLLEEAAGKGGDAIKITTFAHMPEDNLKVLELIPWGRRHFDIDVIAFCMGPLGRWSRFACLPLGSPWTYVQLPELHAAAPGQLTAPEMMAMLKAGGWR